MDSRALDMLRAARASLLREQPFFATLALRLVLEEAPELTGPDGAPSIAGTDGRRLLYRPDLVRQMTAPQLRFILAHEAMHCALGHHARRGARDPDLWNQAADHAVNLALENARAGEPPGEPLADPAYKGLEAETIYTRLHRPKPQQGQGTPQAGPPSQGALTGHVMDATGANGQPATPAELDAQAGQWRAALSQAAAVAKARGTLPADLARLVHENLTPRVDWRAVLAAFLERARDDYSWTHPNRRHIAAGLYLPGMHSEKLAALVVAVDTSGSIGPDDMDRVAAEVSGIMEQHPGSAVDVVYCDAEVQGAEHFTSDELPIKMHPRGGGGTEFAPVFAWVDEQPAPPRAVVYLTDLCGPVPPHPPDYPVLWISTTDRIAPWGETVHMQGRQ